MGKRIANMLRWADEDTKLDWAGCKLNNLTDYHVLALDLHGWRIIPKDPADDCKWPFDSERTECPCPEWAEDLSAKPAAKVLPFTDGDKQEQL